MGWMWWRKMERWCTRSLYGMMMATLCLAWHSDGRKCPPGSSSVWVRSCSSKFGALGSTFTRPTVHRERQGQYHTPHQCQFCGFRYFLYPLYIHIHTKNTNPYFLYSCFYTVTVFFSNDSTVNIKKIIAPNSLDNYTHNTPHAKPL